MKTTVKGMPALMRAIKVFKALDLPSVWTIKKRGKAGVERCEDQLELLTCTYMMGQGVLKDQVDIEVIYDEDDTEVPTVWVNVIFEYAL